MRENTDDVLAGALEKILFNESELNEIKEAIQGLATGKINTSQFKKILILSKRKALEETLDLFPFYSKKKEANKRLSNFTGIKDKDKENELKEKNEFLTEIASRIATIRENLERLQRKKRDPISKTNII